MRATFVVVLSTLAKVLLCLVLVDLWVRGEFFDTYVAPLYAPAGHLLRDRSGGLRLSILLDAIDRLPRQHLRVAFVGDSTMNANAADNTEIPAVVRAELAKRMPGMRIDSIECGLIGLYVTDAALWIDKLLSDGVDVIVYGLVPRAFAQRRIAQRVTALPSELSPRDVAQMFEAGNADWLFQNTSGEDLTAGAVQAAWKTYSYRVLLRRVVAQRLAAAITAAGADVPALLRPEIESPQVASGPPGTRGGLEWSREEYSDSNPNWAVLGVIGRLCAQYAPGRCIVYAGPINPIGRGMLVEPDVYQDYLRRLRVGAGRYGLIFRDYTNALRAEDFRRPMFRAGRDPIHPGETGRAKLAALLAEPVAEAIRCRLGKGDCLQPGRDDIKGTVVSEAALTSRG